MLTNKQEKLIKSLHTKKGRKESGLCLVEGEKNIEMAQGTIDFTFTENDTENFNRLITTQTPQNAAAVAHIPQHTIEAIEKAHNVVILDAVQDPGNVGTVLRLCLAMDAAVILIESADPANPKVIRSSAGSFFKTPWVQMKREEAEAYIKSSQRQILRLENKQNAISIQDAPKKTKSFLIAGSEGSGITLSVNGQSIHIPHNKELESLNVASALAITLWELQK